VRVAFLPCWISEGWLTCRAATGYVLGRGRRKRATLGIVRGRSPHARAPGGDHPFTRASLFFFRANKPQHVLDAARSASWSRTESTESCGASSVTLASIPFTLLLCCFFRRHLAYTLINMRVRRCRDESRGRARALVGVTAPHGDRRRVLANCYEQRQHISRVASPSAAAPPRANA
jgi:hypothetical protein